MIVAGRNFGDLLEDQHTPIAPSAEDVYLQCSFDRCRIHIKKACQVGAFKLCHFEDCELVLDADGPGMSAFDLGTCLFYQYGRREALQ